MINKFLSIIISFLFFVFCSCEHEAEIKVQKSIDLNYSNTSIEIDSGTIYLSELPSYSSESAIEFVLESFPNSNNSIRIDSLGRIKTDVNLNLGLYQISIKAKHADGLEYFFNIVQIKVKKPAILVSFQNDILPIINLNCGPCHTSGSESFKIYANAKVRVDEILRRTQLQNTDSDFMPSGKTPISSKEIELIKQWKAEGLSN